MNWTGMVGYSRTDVLPLWLATQERSMTEPWNASGREATPPDVALSRRRWLQLGLAGLGTAAATAGLLWGTLRPGSDEEVLSPGQEDAAGLDLYPAAADSRFADAGRPLTDETAAARYTNFYEFS